MGLRREVIEEMEEREYQAGAENIMRRFCDNSDADIHGIGWNILHKKFIEDSEPTASEKEIMRLQLELHQKKNSR